MLGTLLWELDQLSVESGFTWDAMNLQGKDRKALRHLRFLEGNGLLESKAETTENGTEIAFKPTE